MKLIVICAWCGKSIRFKDAPGDKPPKIPISHAICSKCKEKLMAEVASELCVNHQKNITKEKNNERKRQI